MLKIMEYEYSKQAKRLVQKILPIRRHINKRKYSDRGLRLAICKGIVENHYGKIWVNRVPVQGDTFSFSIPRGTY